MEALEDALVQLHLLGALDEDGALTEVGAHLAQLPVDPPLGRFVSAPQCGAMLFGLCSSSSRQHHKHCTCWKRRTKTEP